MNKLQRASGVSSSSETAQNSDNNALLFGSRGRLYRLPQVLALIPVSKSSWFEGIKAGRYPRGFQLGPRTTVWRSDDIDRLIQSLELVA